MGRITSSLSLNRETIRKLDDYQLFGVGGGCPIFFMQGTYAMFSCDIQVCTKYTQHNMWSKCDGQPAGPAPPPNFGEVTLP